MSACQRPILRAVALLLLASLPAAAPTPPPGASLPRRAPQQAAPSAAEAMAVAALAAIQTAVEERKVEGLKEALVKLDPIWKDISPKTTQKLVKAIGSLFARFKPQIEEDVDPFGDDPDSPFRPTDDPDKYADDSREPLLECYRAAIGVLSDKPQGPETLLPVLKLPHIKAWPQVQALILQGLGFREDPALMKDFEAYLDDPSPAVASQAARALGRYAEQSVEVKRRAVAALIGALEAADKAAAKEAAKVREEEPTPAADYRASVFVGFHEALLALTRQNFDKAPEWREWFDAHGKDAAW